MDLALEVCHKLPIPFYYYCFNPCFRGSSSRSLKEAVPRAKYLGFNPCFRGSSSRSFVNWSSRNGPPIGFNPCFRGSSSRSESLCESMAIGQQGFNPCFRGSSSRSLPTSTLFFTFLLVSILVFVDLALEADPANFLIIAPN